LAYSSLPDRFAVVILLLTRTAEKDGGLDKQCVKPQPLKLVLEAFKEAHPEIEEQNTLVHNFAV
jgi:hypothetical protein